MKEVDLYVVMPRGCNFGWGVCGRYLAFEMSRRKRVGYVCEEFKPEDIGNHEQYDALSKLWVPENHWGEPGQHAGPIPLEVPTIQAIRGQDLRPITMNVTSPCTLGYTFFETPFLRTEDVERANDYYDVVVGGSRWCEDVLSDQGVKNTSTIIQGVDTKVFHPEIGDKELFRDQFVIFSGGKFELRKGQDLVIRAFRVLHERHDNVMLVNCWYNPWHQSLLTMQSSPYISFPSLNGNYFRFMDQVLRENGIDPRKVVTLPPTPQGEMPDVYKNTDCAIFPNRCEGGTNLVLMEYMACGKPAIASYSSGHRDVLDANNAIPLRSLKRFDIRTSRGELINRWDDPDLEELVEKLEWSYQNRETVKQIGRTAAESMRRFSWQRAAESFLQLLEETSH